MVAKCTCITTYAALDRAHKTVLMSDVSFELLEDAGWPNQSGHFQMILPTNSARFQYYGFVVGKRYSLDLKL